MVLASCGFEDAIDYDPFSMGVVAVTLVSDSPDSIFLTASLMTNIPREGQRSNEIMAAKSGLYYLNVTIDRPSAGFLDFDDERFNLIMLPNDTVYVAAAVDQGRIELSFSGKGFEINEYYKAKKAYFGYADLRSSIDPIYSSSATYESIRHHVDSLIDTELTFFSDYSTKNELPLWFREYEEAEIRYLGLGMLTQLPHYNEIFELFEDELSDRYYSFIEKEMVDNPKAMQSSRYLWFLDDYFISDLPVTQFKDLSGFLRFNTIHQHILKRSKSELTSEVKALYHKYLFSSMIRFFGDSSSIDSLARVYGVRDYDGLLAGAGTQSRANRARLGLIQGDTVPVFYVVNEEDSLVSIRDYADKVLYVNFWATWCGPCIKNFPALNEMISTYTDREEISFINICLDSEKDRWAQAIKRHKLKGDNLYAEGNWNDRLHAIFDIKEIPDYVLVDKGNILHQNYSGQAPAVKSLIDSLLSVRGPTL